MVAVKTTAARNAAVRPTAISENSMVALPSVRVATVARPRPARLLPAAQWLSTGSGSRQNTASIGLEKPENLLSAAFFVRAQ
jgi:hypothetical protein